MSIGRPALSRLVVRARARTAVPAVLAAAVALVAVANAADARSSAPQKPPRYAGHAVAPLRAPDFALRDQDGRLVRLSEQRGRFVVLAFLYTHCHDVCPLIASSLNEALRELGPARRQVRVLAVSVDPAGDTPRAVRAFLARRGAVPQFRYLRGTRSDLMPVWQSYNVLIDASNLRSIGHSAFEWLIDRRGLVRIGYDSNVRTGQVLHDLRILLKRR